MTSIVPPPNAPLASGTALRARRCSRHVQREAVARCLACGGDFCRECVVEHEGKLICAACLARKSNATTVSSARRWGPIVKDTFTTIAGLLVLWGVFYEIGTYLVRVPAPVHEGTLWKRAVEELESSHER